MTDIKLSLEKDLLIVVVCGDGIIFDDDNLNILRREKTIAARTNMKVLRARKK